jgi:NTP pyrophosphatase (non-canonical NTP hydrolase)
MDLKEYQKLAAEMIDRIDRKFNLDRDAQLNLSQLIEEIGELARIVNLERLRGKKPEKKDLEDEFADVLLQVAKLADLFDVDLERAILDKIGILKERHGLG